ncbi:MAG TPA: cell division topological specificity factor MinE [Stellaceae bacterium]|nr:cell division topological specificity factor MinE [Stellaceae bacterium]
MDFLRFLFGRRQASASIAKERLQLVLAHERAGRDAPDFLPALQRDLLAVIGKYVEIREDLVRVTIGRQNGASVLEINVEFDGSAKPIERPQRRAVPRPKPATRRPQADANSA